MNSLALDLLGRAAAWQRPEYLYSLYPAISPSLIDSYLRALVEPGFLVIEGSAAAALDTEYETFWQWDVTAGLYHFGVKDPPWLDEAQSAAWMHQISSAKPPVPLCTSNDGLHTVVTLDPPVLDQGVFSVMRRRRSVRAYVREMVSHDALRDCLFAGLGITGFLHTQLPGDEPRVPLKMTPSGGGRNPYEGYVYVQRVEGVEPGVYHYSAIDNTLGLLTRSPAALPSEVFAGQRWTDNANFGILLVANFTRTMWKYPHPNAYRVVLMEAGHIGQNIALAAAEHELSATPTGAVNDTAAHRLLGLDWVRQSLVYAIFVGKPKLDAFELRCHVAQTPSPAGRTT